MVLMVIRFQYGARLRSFCSIGRFKRRGFDFCFVGLAYILCVANLLITSLMCLGSL